MTILYEASRLPHSQLLHHLVKHDGSSPYISLCGRKMSTYLRSSAHEDWMSWEHYTLCWDTYDNVCQACLDTIDPLVLLDMVDL